MCLKMTHKKENQTNKTKNWHFEHQIYTEKYYHLPKMIKKICPSDLLTKLFATFGNESNILFYAGAFFAEENTEKINEMKRERERKKFTAKVQPSIKSVWHMGFKRRNTSEKNLIIRKNLTPKIQ